MTELTDIRQRYENALETLIAQVKQDTTILAAVLLGSLSHDVVWEKSDIDLLLITQEVKLLRASFCLVEDDINIHAFLKTRSEFKRMLEGATQSSFIHSLLMKGRILFSPIFDFLSAAGGVRSATEINHHFSKQMNLADVDSLCEWLTDENFLQKLAAPLRLTEKSRVNVQEAAYYCTSA